MSRIGDHIRRWLRFDGARKPAAPAANPGAATRTAPKPASASAGRSQPTPASRRLHLGLDFGTCWSKLVLRDYESAQPRCFVVRPPRSYQGAGDYRIPSAVVIDDDRMVFGWKGQQLAGCNGATTYASPKMQAAFG